LQSPLRLSPRCSTLCDAGIEDYEQLQEGHKSFLAECNELRYCSEDMESELAKVLFGAAEGIIALEASARSAEAQSDPSSYVCNVQSIGGLCLLMPEGEPLAADYIRWLSAEVTGLPEMFAIVNKKFISAAVEGALVMAGDFIDLDALQNFAAGSGADILPTEHDVHRAACAVSKKLWHSIYDYVLAAIRAKFHEVTVTCDSLYFDLMIMTLLPFQTLLKEKEVTEDVHINITSQDHPEGDVYLEVVKIASENVTTSDGLGAAETVPS
jgi:hypothetical protein